LSVWT